MLQLVPKIFLFVLVGDRGDMMFNSGGALLMLWGGDWGCDSLKMLGGGGFFKYLSWGTTLLVVLVLMQQIAGCIAPLLVPTTGDGTSSIHFYLYLLYCHNQSREERQQSGVWGGSMSFLLFLLQGCMKLKRK